MQLTKNHLLYMHLGMRYWKATIDSFTEAQSQCLNPYLTTWEHFLANGMGAFIWGTNSTGKTYVVSALCKAVWGRYGLSSYFVTAEDLKECWIDTSLPAHEGSYELMIDRVRDVKFLVIDDLAKEYRTASGFAENKLGNLIRRRQNNLLITTITTNLAPNQFKQVYGDSAFELVKEGMIPCKLSEGNMRDHVLRTIQNMTV